MTSAEILRELLDNERELGKKGEAYLDLRVLHAIEALLREHDTLSISFDGEASEGFADRIANMAGWYVRLTPQDGNPFDAVIVGSAQDETDEDGNGWYDSVRYLDADPDSGLAVDGAEPKTVRVTDVYIY